MKQEQLEELFARVLAVPLTSLSDESSPVTIKNWDSLAQLRLLMSMEETYKVSFTRSEVRSLNSLAIARNILSQKGITL